MEYPVDSIADGAEEIIWTTDVTHQEMFHIHLESREKIIEDITALLEQKYNHLGDHDKPLKNFRLGAICAAKFNDDNQWYRAKITGIQHTGGFIEVRFVDYGNRDSVTKDRVKELDYDLTQYPVQAYLCGLAGLSADKGFWPPEQTVLLEDKILDKKCKAVFKSKREQEDHYFVELFDEEGKSINKMFGATDASINASCNQFSGKTGFKNMEWPVGHQIQSTVVYVRNPGTFWCQELKYSNDIVELSEALARAHMTGELTPLRKVAPGITCAAKFSEDDSWYRGIVESVSNNVARVYFVDYGNTENVDVGLICELAADKRKLPALAVECALANVDDGGKGWGDDVIEEFEGLVVDRDLEVKTVGKKGGIHIVSLLDIVENKDIATSLKPVIARSSGAKKSRNVNGNNVPSASASNASAVSEVQEEEGPILTVGNEAEVYLSWVTNPGDFWVQRVDSQDQLDKLSEDIQQYYSQPRPLAVPGPGAFVVARFSEDQRWYRGLVLKEVEDKARVLFIDYGNSDMVAKSELRQVTQALGMVYPLAFRCSMLGIRPLRQDGPQWCSDAKDFLEKLTENGCMCKVLKKNDNHLFVELSINGKSVAQELVSLAVVEDASGQQVDSRSQGPKFSSRVTFYQGQSESVTVTHIDSPQCLWLQPVSSSGQLDALMEKLELHYSEDGGTPVSRPSQGQACVAQYSEDNMWYRATIESITAQGIKVRFVDYGNSEMVNSKLVCVPEPRFLDLPTQAVQCSLPLQGDVSYLTDSLTDLTFEKELTAKVLNMQGTTPCVELYENGQALSSQLKSAPAQPVKQHSNTASLKSPQDIPAGTKFSAFASVVVSTGKFFLQKAGIDEELETLMDTISSVYGSGSQPNVATPKPGLYCVALYSEDGAWYRGRIQSVQEGSCSVLFVDYGNEETISLSNIKALDPSVSKTPILAYQCSLSGFPRNQDNQAANDAFESLIMDKELSCIFKDDDKVEITCDGSDVLASLAAQGHCSAASKPQQAQTSFAPRSQGGGSGFGSRNNDESSGGFGGNSQGGFGSKGFGSRGSDDSKGSFGGGNRDDSSGGFGGGRSQGGGGGGFGSRSNGFGGKKEEDSSGDSGFGGKSRGSGFGGSSRDVGADGDNATLTYPDPPSDPESAILVHMDEDGAFYLQLPSMEKDIVFLAKRLAGSYKGGKGPRVQDEIVKGTICCGKFPDDGGMYRCIVEEVAGGKMIVRYVDFGNTAECTPYDLKKLFPDLLQYPVQAFPCKLKGLKWSVDQADKFAEATLDKDLEVTFAGTSKPYEVEIKTPDGDLLAIMEGKIKISSKPKADPTPSSGFGSSSSQSKGSSQGGGFGSGGSSQGSGFGSKGGGFGGGGSSQASGFGSQSSGGFGSSNSNQSMKASVPATSPVKPKIPNQVLKDQCAPQGELTAFITHVGEDGYFFVQLEKDTDDIEKTCDSLATIKSSDKHPNPTVGFVCAALFSEDSSWYRARIMKSEGSQLALTFVDYGNGDKVESSSIKPLSEELLKNPPLAYQCKFEELGPLSTDCQERLSEYLMDHEMRIKFQGQSAPFSITAKTTSGEDLQEIVSPSTQYKAPVVPSDVTPAGVCHIEEDGRFFIQLYSEYRWLAKLDRDMNTLNEKGSLIELESLEKDTPCCLKNENKWYRGKISSVSDKTACVFCVDYGFTKSSDTSELKCSVPKLLKKPPLAIECRMKGVENWTEDLKSKFVEMTDGKILNATFATRDLPCRVSLARSLELDLLGLSGPELDQSAFEEEEVESPTADSAPSQPDAASATAADASQSEVLVGKAAYISHMEADGSFYLQMADQEDNLAALADGLEADLAEAQALQDPSPGMAVCAKFTEDDAWYRAIIEEACDDKFLVRFIDYGNTDSLATERLAKIPDGSRTEDTPAFACKCKLNGLTTALSEDQVEKLRSSTEDQTVGVEFVSKEASFHLVSLYLGGKDVLVLLGLKQALNESSSSEGQEEFADAVEQQDGQANQGQAQTVEAGRRVAITVSFAENPGSFYMQKNSSQGELDELMNTMFDHFSGLPEGEGCVEAPAVGQLCAALYEDESWYRVKVTKVNDDGTVEVHYHDHGNTEVTDISSIRTLPSNFKEPASLMMHARLCGVEPVGDDWTPEAKECFKEMVEEKSLLADIIKIENDLHIVKLLEMGIPVHEELIKKEHAKETDESVRPPPSVHGVFDESCASQDHSVSNLESTRMENGQASKIECGSSDLAELEECTAYVSHAESPSLFWCQLDSSIDILDSISGALAEGYGSAAEADKASPKLACGDFVVALSPDDEVLYRAKVIKDYGDNKVAVRFVDYGNESEVSRDKIYSIKDEDTKIPSQAFMCCLDKIKPAATDDDWSQEACDKFSELVMDKELVLKLVGRNSGEGVIVDLVGSDNLSIVSALLEAGFGQAAEGGKLTKCSNLSEVSALELSQPLLESTVFQAASSTSLMDSQLSFEKEGQYRYVKLSLHSEYEAYIPSSECPSAFSLRLAAMKSQFSSLMDEVAEHCLSATEDDSSPFAPCVGSPCLALHQAVWHRALVLEAPQDQDCKVRLVDVGAEPCLPISALRCLPSRLADLPAQAVAATLAGVVSVEPQWCPDAVTFFKDFVMNTKVTVHIFEHAEDGKYGVYITEAEDTTHQSLNRALVDLGYAEVVPGSNIDVQIEMEKTLDTDMLDDLEASFHEVNEKRGDDLELERLRNDQAVSGEVADSLAEAKGELSCVDADGDNKNNNAVVPSTAEKSPSNDEVEVTRAVSSLPRFSLADDVERITKLGCVDPNPEDSPTSDFEIDEKDKHEHEDSPTSDFENDAKDKNGPEMLPIDLLRLDQVIDLKLKECEKEIEGSNLPDDREKTEINNIDSREAHQEEPESVEHMTNEVPSVVLNKAAASVTEHFCTNESSGKKEIKVDQDEELNEIAKEKENEDKQVYFNNAGKDDEEKSLVDEDDSLVTLDRTGYSSEMTEDISVGLIRRSDIGESESEEKSLEHSVDGTTKASDEDLDAAQHTNKILNGEENGTSKLLDNDQQLTVIEEEYSSPNSSDSPNTSAFVSCLELNESCVSANSNDGSADCSIEVSEMKIHFKRCDHNMSQVTNESISKDDTLENSSQGFEADNEKDSSQNEETTDAPDAGDDGSFYNRSALNMSDFSTIEQTRNDSYDSNLCLSDSSLNPETTYDDSDIDESKTESMNDSSTNCLTIDMNDSKRKDSITSESSNSFYSPNASIVDGSNVSMQAREADDSDISSLDLNEYQSLQYDQETEDELKKLNNESVRSCSQDASNNSTDTSTDVTLEKSSDSSSSPSIKSKNLDMSDPPSYHEDLEEEEGEKAVGAPSESEAVPVSEDADGDKKNVADGAYADVDISSAVEKVAEELEADGRGRMNLSQVLERSGEEADDGEEKEAEDTEDKVKNEKQTGVINGVYFEKEEEEGGEDKAANKCDLGEDPSSSEA